jgi:hypothetical protein
VGLLAGALIAPAGRGAPPVRPGVTSPADPARDAVQCLRDRRTPDAYLVAVMLIAERDGPSVPGLIREIRRGVTALDEAYSKQSAGGRQAGADDRDGDAGLMAAVFALTSRAEAHDDPSAAEAHFTAAAQLVESGGAGSPGTREAAAAVLGATELARTARAFGDPRAGDWQRQAAVRAQHLGNDNSRIAILARAELTGAPVPRGRPVRPHCAFDHLAALSHHPLTAPTSDDVLAASLLAAVSPRRS